jgi:hypothetical protein
MHEPAMTLMLRLGLGIMTAWGSLFAIAALGIDLGIAGASGSPPDDGSVFWPAIRALSAINAFAIFLVFAVIALRSRYLHAIDGVAWIFALMFFYPVAMPAFWFFQVLRERRNTLGPGEPPDPRP